MERKQRKTSIAVLAGLTLVVASIGSAFAQDGPQGGPGGPPPDQGGFGPGGSGGRGVQGGPGGRQGGPGGQMGRRQGPPPPASLIFMPREVLDKLDLTDDEFEKIRTARQDFMEKHHPEQPKQGTERPTREQMDARRKKMEAEVDEADKALLGQLSGEHRNEVEKIVKDMKVMASVHLPAHLVLDLKLTDDQLSKLSGIAPKDGVKGDPDELKEKVDAVLTKQQKRILRSARQGGPGVGGPGMGGPGGPGGRGGPGPDGGPGGPGGGPGGPGGPDGGPGGPPPGGEDFAD